MKKRMLISLSMIFLVAALVGGATFAIFTDTATNNDNTFAAGTLQISLDKPDGTKYFEISDIAPGDSGSANVTVSNDGSLELRYDIAETLTGALAAGVNGLDVVIKDAGSNAIVPGDNNRVLAAGASEVLTVEWALPLAAGNEYQETSATYGITVSAEQTKNN